MFESFYINSAVEYGKTELTSFDSALLQSGMGNYNLVRVSSILPPQCTQREKILLQEGSPLHIAYASITTNISGKLISSAVAVGIPSNPNYVGVIMEYSAHENETVCREIVRGMVAEAMTNRGYDIKQILISSCEAVCDGEAFVTAFSGLAMW